MPLHPDPAAPEPTVVSFVGAESHIYRPNSSLYVHVFKPAGGEKLSAPKPAFIFFFGGGWRIGAARVGVRWAQMAAANGIIGIAPDYRTEQRFNSTPMDAIADGRAVLRWVQEHAKELGIDPARIAVGGSSAGGTLAVWTAIAKSPPGSTDPEDKPLAQPAALVLLNPCVDTSVENGYKDERLGEHANAVSPLHNMVEKMPPTLTMHGELDESVPYRQAADLDKRLKELGGESTLIMIPGEGHSFFGLDAWKDKVNQQVMDFLKEHLHPDTPAKN